MHYSECWSQVQQTVYHFLWAPILKLCRDTGASPNLRHGMTAPLSSCPVFNCPMPQGLLGASWAGLNVFSTGGGGWQSTRGVRCRCVEKRWRGGWRGNHGESSGGKPSTQMQRGEGAFMKEEKHAGDIHHHRTHWYIWSSWQTDTTAIDWYGAQCGPSGDSDSILCLFSVDKENVFYDLCNFISECHQYLSQNDAKITFLPLKDLGTAPKHCNPHFIYCLGLCFIYFIYCIYILILPCQRGYVFVRVCWFLSRITQKLWIFHGTWTADVSQPWLNPVHFWCRSG